MSKNGAKIGLKQGLWCKQVESKTVKYWQLGTLLPTLFSVHENKGIIFFLKKTRPFSTDLFSTHLNLGHTCKFIPPPWYGEGGGGLMEPLPRGFDVLQYFEAFLLQWKAFDQLNKMRYILWVVVLLEACDVTNNGRHLGFYQELEITLKPQEMVIFVLDM